MQVYTVISEFNLTPCNITLEVGDTVGKLSGSVLVVINGTEYDNKALYNWIGSVNSADQLSFVGVVPDPPVGGSVPTTPVTAPASSSSAGTQGTWAYDGVYLYWCVATDTWFRWVCATSF